MKKLALSLFGAILLLATTPGFGATNFSANLCMPEPTPGDPASTNTWGTLMNNGTAIVDGATSATTSVNVAGSSNVILSFNCGQTDGTTFSHFNLTGVLTGNITVFWPSGRNREFSVINNTTGSFTVTLAVNNGSGAPAGNTVPIPQTNSTLYGSSVDGGMVLVTDDGTNMAVRNANLTTHLAPGSVNPGFACLTPTCSLILNWGTGTATVAGTAIGYAQTLQNGTLSITFGENSQPLTVSGATTTGFTVHSTSGTVIFSYMSIGF